MAAAAVCRVFGTPAAVVDGDVKISGKVPKEKDIKARLAG